MRTAAPRRSPATMPNDGSATSAMVAASAAPPEAPITNGSASGLRNRPWYSTPETASAAPARAAPIDTWQTNLNDDGLFSRLDQVIAPRGDAQLDGQWPGDDGAKRYRHRANRRCEAIDRTSSAARLSSGTRARCQRPAPE